MWTRRALVRSGGALAVLGLAGCLGSGSPGTATRVGTPTPTDRPTTEPTTSRPTYRPSTVSLDLVPTTLPEIADAAVETPASLTDAQRDALDRMRSTGAYELDGVLRADRYPFPGEPFVRLDGTVVRVEETVVAERQITVHRFRVEMVSETPPDAVAFESLSSLDRSVFRAALTEEYLQNGTPFRGTFVYAFDDPDAADRSRFVGDEPVHVAYRDDAFRVEFQRTDRLTATDVRYTLSTVADSPAAFREHLRSTYVRPLSSLGLSAAERGLVRRAIEGSRYREQRPLSTEFAALLEALDSLPTIPNAGRYVRDGDDVYRVAQSAVEA